MKLKELEVLTLIKHHNKVYIQMGENIESKDEIILLNILPKKIIKKIVSFYNESEVIRFKQGQRVIEIPNTDGIYINSYLIVMPKIREVKYYGR